jgi:hypothetical protein
MKTPAPWTLLFLFGGSVVLLGDQKALETQLAPLVRTEQQITAMVQQPDHQHLLPADAKFVAFSEVKQGSAGEPYLYRDVEGELINNQLHFHCKPDMFSRLTFNGAPMTAKGVVFSFSGIQWQAGVGWPTYSTRVPQSNVLARAPFPASIHHMLVVVCGGQFSDADLNLDAIVGSQSGDVFVGPNDELLEDNTGAFDFIVFGIAQ